MAMTDPWLERPDDYYAILGVDRGLPNLDAILKPLYRARALQYHPDFATDDRDRAQRTIKLAQINQAQAVLADPAARARYDRWLELEGAAHAIAEATPAAARPASRQPTPPGRPAEAAREDAEPPPSALRCVPAALQLTLRRDQLQPRGIMLIEPRGEPCAAAEERFRLVPPSDPSHPRHEPRHWLRVVATERLAGDRAVPVRVTVEADGRQLWGAPPQLTQLFIAYAGRIIAYPVAVAVAATADDGSDSATTHGPFRRMLRGWLS
jgi:hypothetical protein